MDIPREKKKDPRRPWLIAAIVVGVLVSLLGLSRLGPASPQLEKATLLIDVVKRGELVRRVHGNGTLVPENQRFVSALTAGRVEQVLARPGSPVEASTILIELSNPDVQLEALDAERQLKLAEAELASVRSSLETAKLIQEGSLASSRTELREAERAVAVAERLAQDGLNSTMDVDRARDRLEEAKERNTGEKRRTVVASEAFLAQIELRKADVERLRAIARFQRERVASMQVRAGASGTVQELSLEPGQWVQSGQRLARVASSERLKAVLQVVETQARDLTLGLPTTVDTRDGVVTGRLSRIDPGAQNGFVNVDVTLSDSLPRGARPDMSVEGTVEIEKLDDVVSVGRPALGESETTTRMFKLSADGHSAIRVSVRLGRASFNAVVIESGLVPGDRVILSDMSQWQHVDRVRLK
ncbi:MAG: HlyD family efflux transporter periplasmic adaptor subunit [Candidatus Eisenbacteria bacterium]|uniref:HlyD family efflux transporter periplasmic adaptor subunit n=1 Tax=Eiseniibacteriota bacterium TaxID=2212470 RepID=A0A849SS47_UNCEI|nr:HlyD family efflux transporter periplasmic adaptor subunit [Candidatus Eisenbacteria bacterium]